MERPKIVMEQLDMQSTHALHLLGACKMLRAKIPGDLPIQQLMILVFLYVHPGKNQTAIAKYLGLRTAGCSRHCRSLSTSYAEDPETGEIARSGGQGLIVGARNPARPREMMYHLTDETDEVIAAFLARIGANRE